MYKVFFSNRLLKKSRNRNHNDDSPPKNNEINEGLNSLEPEIEINVHAADQNNGISEILNSLEPGTEINVHAADQTYYNALFLAFDRRTNKVSLLTDRFYKRGNRLTILELKDIISIDLPVSGDSAEKLDDEDE
ncbi:hypothetical protein [Thermaerobacillus caldiproteolyticus]|uniref:hypothetical protein n=1 Tax=Thermaerobacillus caldiproteolyticus TaxID=247480 RepID=UPI0018F2384F|nr:hypothetical protein [Anoxybacillus caldiproteolyticus]